METMIFSR